MWRYYVHQGRPFHKVVFAEPRNTKPRIARGPKPDPNTANNQHPTPAAKRDIARISAVIVVLLKVRLLFMIGFACVQSSWVESIA